MYWSKANLSTWHSPCWSTMFQPRTPPVHKDSSTITIAVFWAITMNVLLDGPSALLTSDVSTTYRLPVLLARFSMMVVVSWMMNVSAISSVPRFSPVWCALLIDGDPVLIRLGKMLFWHLFVKYLKSNASTRVPVSPFWETFS